MLTGIEDTNVKIIENLNLRELRQVCQTNKYILNLCQTNTMLKRKMNKVNKRVNRIMNILSTRDDIIDIKLLLNNKNQTFNDFFNILNKLSILSFYVDGETIYRDKTLEFFKKHEVININFNLDYISFPTYYYDYDVEDFSELNITLSNNALQEFLTHIYYNQLILII
ncbi:MAG TPA: hypothetical protein VLG50_07880 [Candidatus Saccharimonadales bacterium]|nr:hypothetical protein [Candidatus Saccharimonadales bacterium]